MSTPTIGAVTFDSTEPLTLAGFWSDLLAVPVDNGADDSWATVGAAGALAPYLSFAQVPDRNPGKNVVHLDLTVPDLDAAVDRAIGLGAKRVADIDENGARWTTLADPEGNLFDIVSE